MTFSPSQTANRAWALVTALQTRFVEGLQASTSNSYPFQKVPWLRDAGKCGGGHRLMAPAGTAYNRGSVNVSHVHYTGMTDKALDSATALSTIIHPISPLIPSVHIHVSWTEMKTTSAQQQKGYFRIMADLNPAIKCDPDTRSFEDALRLAAGRWYESGARQGEQYFFIPALGRHRGVTHFYLEQHASGDIGGDFALAKQVGEAAIDSYCETLSRHLKQNVKPTASNYAEQLAYHTLYLYQVLTLDRGTTSGLLVHAENDVGILGSLPARVDRNLLASWQAKSAPELAQLVANIVGVIPENGEINDPQKEGLAKVVRNFFRDHPAALQLQARGDILPPTVANHGASSLP
jgi:coproporphyrinogen III oxidase